MKSRTEISNQLEITEAYLSMLMNNKRPVSWVLAEKLTDLFPGKSLREWKNATPGELRRAFEQLPELLNPRCNKEKATAA